MNPRDVPIPDRMKHLPLDPRGYPMFAMVITDQSGKAHFAVNNENKRQELINGDLCGICGKPLLRGRWLVGGPASAFHEHGAYIDPPMHEECVHYALKVCPYLAAPRWAGTGIGMKMYEQADWGEGDRYKPAAYENTTSIPGRPALFVAVMHVGQSYVYYDTDENPLLAREHFIEYVRPKRPLRRVEYWAHGGQLPDAEGKPLADKIVADILAREAAGTLRPFERTAESK